MHELAATQSMLETAVQRAQAAGAQRITDMQVVLGQMSDLTIASVQFYWDSISPGTLAEGARLHFRRVPAELLCLNCNHRYAPAEDEMACPACGSAKLKVVAGMEFYLEALDIEPRESVTRQMSGGKCHLPPDPWHS